MQQAGQALFLKFRPPTLLRAIFDQAGGEEAPYQAHPLPPAPTGSVQRCGDRSRATARDCP
ncbi:MAG TPA: hypothetical protein VKY19_16695 [Ktedonosporobacter sp.]|nr:hypothetical protein [Ktedonosporobacter sp.]